MRKPINTPANREWLRRLFRLVNARIAIREKLLWAVSSQNEKQQVALSAEMSRVEEEIRQHEAAG